MQCLMRSDGTTLIKDAVHNIAATLTGTPTTATLLGVTAPVVSAAAYTSVIFPMASLGIAAGQPISFIAAVKTTWAGNDGAFHVFSQTRQSFWPMSTNGWELVKGFLGGQDYFYFVVWDSAGNYHWRAMVVDATNWAANTTHIIVVTVDADNAQHLYLDGAEAPQDIWTPAGSTYGRESAVGTDLWLGSETGLMFPIDGSELCAIYSGILTGAQIDDISAMTDWSNLDGIVNPPPPPAPVYVRQPPGAHIIVQNMAGTSTLAELSERMPDQKPATNLFEGLSFESVNPGGFTTADFVLHRPVTQSWPDLGYRNRIIIGQGQQTFWEGYIDKPVRKIRPDTFEVGCLGWSSRLNQLWTTADIVVVAATDHLSKFINNVVLADTALLTPGEIVAGTIETGDFDYADGTRWEFAPATTYFDAIEQMNAGNGYNWGVWLDHKFDFKAPTPTVIQWYVKTADCEDLTITPNPDALCNYALINYTQDGSHFQQVIVQDAASIALYGLIKKKVDVPGKIITSGATQIANLYLAACKDLHVAAEFTTNRIYDIWGAEHPLGEVRGGDNIRVVDWLPTEDTLSGVNDIATFQIKSAKYDHDKYNLGITPTEFIPATDIMIARLQAVGY